MNHLVNYNQTMLGFRKEPPASPWGINFGGGLNSTAVVFECFRRGFKPDWILFADTGSERPDTIDHVVKVAEWCLEKGWPFQVVQWIRKEGHFEALHDNCLRTSYLPSKSYGYAGCTDKWKVQPMEKWRKEKGFDRGAFAVGYDAGEHRRIRRACQRGDNLNMIAWYPLVAWEINREGCQKTCSSFGFDAVPKSSCFMCPNMRPDEWRELREKYPDLMNTALEIERRAVAAGNAQQGGLIRKSLAEWNEGDILADRCHHGGCFT